MLVLRLWWSAPSRVKHRSAWNCASIRLSHDALVGTYASSTLFAAAESPTRVSLRIERCGLKLSNTIAIRTEVGYSEPMYRKERR